jgi:hypothetical protein
MPSLLLGDDVNGDSVDDGIVGPGDGGIIGPGQHSFFDARNAPWLSLAPWWPIGTSGRDVVPDVVVPTAALRGVPKDEPIEQTRKASKSSAVMASHSSSTVIPLGARVMTLLQKDWMSVMSPRLMTSDWLPSPLNANSGIVPSPIARSDGTVSNPSCTSALLSRDSSSRRSTTLQM